MPANKIQKTITQASHNLSIGHVIYHNGTNFQKAKADSFDTADVLGVVSAVDGDDFTFIMAGYISVLSGLTAGNVYYLSSTTAGDTSLNEPDISVPSWIGRSITSDHRYSNLSLGLNGIPED